MNAISRRSAGKTKLAGRLKPLTQPFKLKALSSETDVGSRIVAGLFRVLLWDSIGSSYAPSALSAQSCHLPGHTRGH